ETDLTLPLPALHWPAQPAPESRHKRIAILLDGTDETIVEAVRLGAGLAGCDHRITLCLPGGGSMRFPEPAMPYLDALNALGARIDSTSEVETIQAAHDLVLHL
ncbi:MAG: hypothetical protein HQM00_10185, partial [Magnetococcales bacterium]|nr:hypothetical protein [Magnetococcales bacterium]